MTSADCARHGAAKRGARPLMIAYNAPSMPDRELSTAMRDRARHIAGTLLIGTITLYLGSGPARADAIDGEWCLGVNHFAIQGPDIVTPGGHQIKGNYWRHGFVYVVPAGETDAGREVDMRLLNEETVELTRKGQSSPAETWHRCKPTS